MITRLPMENFAAHDIRSYSKMSARELARSYIVDGLFVPGRIELRHWETDRTVVGGASPLGRALVLEAPARLKADHFNDRRELGVTNIGGPGAVTVDGRRFKLNKLDCLYVGRGAKKVVFSSIRKSTPAKYYLLSYPAHTRFPNRTLLAWGRDRIGCARDRESSFPQQGDSSRRDQELPARHGLHDYSPGKSVEHDASPYPCVPIGGLPVL